MSIPSIDDLTSNLSKGFVDGIREKDPSFRDNSNSLRVFDAWSLSLAIAIRGFYLYSQDQVLQSTPLTADSIRNNPKSGQLENWGELFLKRTPFVAGRGQYVVEVDGNGEIPLGTILLEQSTQKICTVDSVYTVSGKTNINITSEEVGEAGRLFVGDQLVFTQLIAGVDELAVVTQEIKAPINEEDIEEYRQKVVQSALIKPRGGSIGDIWKYGVEIDGVANIYPYNGTILGDAVVYIEADSSVSPDGIPPTTLINDVKKNVVLNANFQSPRISFLPVIRRGYIVDITGLSDPTKQSLCEDLVRQYFSTKRPFIDGVDRLADKNKGLIFKASIFGDVFNGIQPAIITDLTLSVENYVANGYVQTKDLSNVTTLYGNSAPSDGSFFLKKDGGTHQLIAVDGRQAQDIHDYALLVAQATSLAGVRTELIFDASKTYLKFSSDFIGAGSTVELITPVNGTDLTSSTYLDIANSTKVDGGTTATVVIQTEKLPTGTIPYLKTINFL